MVTGLVYLAINFNPVVMHLFSTCYVILDLMLGVLGTGGLTDSLPEWSSIRFVSIGDGFG